VKTIDWWGLKSRFLRKHLVDVARFYKQISKTGLLSAAASKWKDRLEKDPRTSLEDARSLGGGLRRALQRRPSEQRHRLHRRRTCEAAAREQRKNRRRRAA
jgi:hypothetical protein